MFARLNPSTVLVSGSHPCGTLITNLRFEVQASVCLHMRVMDLYVHLSMDLCFCGVYGSVCLRVFESVFLYVFGSLSACLCSICLSACL